VNPLTLDGTRYLVAPRGETQWVRNFRVAGDGALRLGRHIEQFQAAEIDDLGKPPILRAYLRLWKAEVGVFFERVSADSSDIELRRIAPAAPGVPDQFGMTHARKEPQSWERAPRRYSSHWHPGPVRGTIR